MARRSDCCFKTIGDAYIATCGAFGEASDEEVLQQSTSASGAAPKKRERDTPGSRIVVTAEQRLKKQQQRQVTARRMVRMALAMQEVIRRKAQATSFDLGLRVGVHTGRVIGGIIGTVRFHFDMCVALPPRFRRQLRGAAHDHPPLCTCSCLSLHMIIRLCARAAA